MSLSKWVFFALPFIFFILYIVAQIGSFEWFKNIGRRTTRRIYYLFCLLYFAPLFYLLYPHVIKIRLFDKYAINNEIYNIACFVIIYWLAVFIWDLLFISSITISSLSFKDFKITTEDAQEIKIAANISDKNIEVLSGILNIQGNMMLEMEEYVQSVDLNEDTMYKDLIKKYANLRKDIRISCYDMSQEGLKQLQKDYKMDDLKLSSINYSLAHSGVCIPNDVEKDVIYAVIYTKAAGDQIIVMEADYLFKNEFLIIQNLICLFDLFIELEYTVNNSL